MRLAALPDGTSVRLEPGQDPRAAFAAWLTSPSNPWFARAAVNRAWFWLLGRGIVHEPDDMRPDNAPSHPELLALLERELVAARFDMKHVYRLILNSTTYQLSAIPASSPAPTPGSFSYALMRPLDAEVLIDALNQITGAGEEVLERDSGAVHVHPARSSDRSRSPTAASGARFSRRSAGRRATPGCSRNAHAADSRAAALPAELGRHAAQAAAGPEDARAPPAAGQTRASS